MRFDRKATSSLSRPTAARTGRVLSRVSWVVAIALAVWTVNSSGFQITVLGGAMAFAIAGIGVGFQLKALRLLSLGQGSMMAIGAYSQLVLVGHDDWSFVPALIVSLLLAAGVGTVLGCASARVRTHYYILLTAAVDAVVAAFISGLPSLTGGAEGASTPAALTLLGAQVNTPKDFAELATVVALVVAALADLSYRSALGRRLIAAGASPALARSSGISLIGANIAGNVLLALAGVLAGAVYAPLIGYLGPDEFALSVSITCVLVGVIATQWSFSMAIIAAVALQELTQQLSSVGSVSGVIYGGIIIVVGVVLAAGERGLTNRLRSWRRGKPSVGALSEEMAVDS